MARLQLRLTETQKAEIVRRAKEAGLTISAYVILQLTL